MKEKPIIFSTDMVRAILDGRKTQTRRVIKPQPEEVYHGPMCLDGDIWAYKKPNQGTRPFIIKCPYGQVGDRLWVRERHRFYAIHKHNYIEYGDGVIRHKPFMSVCPDADTAFDIERTRYFYGIKWKPSIHMPRWASRINLEITEIRVERLQEITEEDAIAEGYTVMVGATASGSMGLASARYAFKVFWDSINGTKYSWESNPWVWVISYKRI